MRRFLRGLWLSPRTFRAASAVWAAGYALLVFSAFATPDNRSMGPLVMSIVVAVFTLDALPLTAGLMRMSRLSVLASVALAAWCAFYIGTTSGDPGNPPEEDLMVGVLVSALVFLPGLLTLVGAIRHWRELTWNPLGKTLERPTPQADVFS